ncbi:hypothetical protein DWS90_23230 [Salmonella enterica subsp. enterica serovar Give]|nr:hypothetical protein [Salmonella enterica]
MKLVRNAVFAVINQFDKRVMAFLHVNKNGHINPFWESECYSDGWSRRGELSECECLRDEGSHDHWFGVEDDGSETVMVQSHVTKASQVDFKRCRKFARNAK